MPVSPHWKDSGVIRDSMVTRILADANTEDARISEIQEMCQYVPATSFMCTYTVCSSPLSP